MKGSAWRLFLLVICLSSLAVEPACGQPLGTNFTYQGQLKQAGAPLNSTADFEFRLFDALSDGAQVGSSQPVNNVSVVDGLFTVSLDFGSSPFNGDQRWLQIAVRSPAGSGSFTTLSPRQPLTATPFALYALNGPSGGGPWTLNGNNIFNTNSGNVGIGTNTPSSKLDIQASNGSNVLFGRRTGGGLAHNLYIDGAGNGSMQLIDSTGNPRAEFANGLGYFNYGNFGIGTKTPSAPLHIANDLPFMVLQDTGSASTQSGYLGFWNNNPSETAWVGFGTPGSPDFSIVNARSNGSMRFHANGAERMIISSPGIVGIGTSSPFLGTALHIAGTGSSVAIFDRPGDGILMRFRTSGGYQGDISVSGSSVSYNGFMGSHYGWTDSQQTNNRGTLIRMTGDNRRLNDSAESDVVYGIEPTTTANDPACLGAYLGIMESDKPADLVNPHLVAAVGNGELLVVDSGTGSIQPGDYLISADVAGCAMKDDPKRFPVGNVVARAGQRVDWSAVARDASGYKVARVPVFFESFVRSNASIGQMGGSADSASIESLRKENGDLRDRIERLEALMKQFSAASAGGLK